MREDDTTEAISKGDDKLFAILIRLHAYAYAHRENE